LVALLCLTIPAPSAAQAAFGKWHVEAADGRIYASTVNDSGHVIGQYCYPKDGKCYWLLGITTKCEKGEKYPILVNSDAGAESVEIYCFGELKSAPGRYQFAFTNFDRANHLVTQSKRIGIAIPLAGDQFRVIRFDVGDAAAAVGAMRDAADTIRPVRGTRDEKL
jgi:hypothetical protein